jgi:hypothetical protein
MYKQLSNIRNIWEIRRRISSVPWKLSGTSMHTDEAHAHTQASVF